MHFIHLDIIPSTNTWVKENLISLDPQEITSITARGQTGGRGRGHKKWLSPTDQNLYLSLHITRAQNYPHLFHLAQLVSLSCVQVLHRHRIHPQLKWPNDILLNSKKCGGVLVEVVTHNNRLHLILGLGLNLNMEEQDLQSVDQKATSLKIETGKTWDVLQIAQEVTEQCAQDLLLLDKQGFSPFLARYQELLIHRKGDPLKGGIFIGINEEGFLVLQLPSGKVEVIRNAD